MTIGGVRIPANSWLLYGNGPAGHDPAAFAEPERVLGSGDELGAGQVLRPELSAAA